jgi:hypothetical protein
MSKGWKYESGRHGLAARGIHTKISCRGHGHATVDFSKGYITEKELSLLHARKNRGEKVDIPWEKFDWEIPLTKEQNKKGYDWLMDLWKTPKGKERKNNPFGYREQSVLEDFDQMYFMDWYAPGRSEWVVPYYRVKSKSGGNTFEYCVYGGEIHILG